MNKHMNPIKLLKIEYLKFRDNLLVQLLLLFFTLLMAFWVFIMKTVDQFPVSIDTFFQFPTSWEYQAYFGSWYSFFFLGFLGIFIVTSEFDFKTLRQNVITGYSRKEFFTAKILVAFAISLYAAIVYYLSTFLIGLIYQDVFSMQEAFSHQNYAFLRFFLLTFAYLSFGMMLALIFRKGTLALFSYFAYILIIEPFVLRWGIHNYFFQKSKSLLYYPMNAVEDLAPLPFYKYIPTFNAVKDFHILMSYSEAAIISTISILVFLLIGYLSLVKRDI